MIELFSPATEKPVSLSRIINKIEGHHPGPTVVFFAGIHGNEPAGIFALEAVLNALSPQDVSGTIYGISGNLAALEKQLRFISCDLNRIWTRDRLKDLYEKEHLSEDEVQQLDIYKLLWDILDHHSGPFYFFDLHTTSSKTLPFITINDALINRRFSKVFPVPIVLGIEEYLSGPLLSYINEIGYVSLGFESGQHDDPEAITNAKAFIAMALVNTGSVTDKPVIDYDASFRQLQEDAHYNHKFFEIVHVHEIQDRETFEMIEGFESFQPIERGVSLAYSNGTLVKASKNGQLFMPLYQKKGEEGFFIIRTIRPFFLQLSSLLRQMKTDNLLTFFPGVSWGDKTIGALEVNLKVARFFAKPVFHLLGYRSRQINETHLRLYNRERVAKTRMYNHTKWYRKNI